jgi:hypothetical protein
MLWILAAVGHALGSAPHPHPDPVPVPPAAPAKDFISGHPERPLTPMETFELSPDGRQSIESFRSLEQAIARAEALLPSRPDVQQFRIYATTGSGHRLVGTVSRDRGYRPA